MEQQLISSLSDQKIDNLINILLPFDKDLIKRVNYVQNRFKTKRADALEYIVTDNPILWAKVYLNWEPRPYQIPIILEAKKSKKLTLRLGRRLGKSECMCVMILWYAYTQYNKGPNNQYDILICTPYETQIDLIFKRLLQLVDMSPLLTSLVSRNIQHKLCFTINGTISTILGITAGANNSSNGANSTRGQRADLLILDEVDYIGSNQITNILNIRNEDPERIRLLCASTPSGKHEEYYKWCTGASKSYEVSEQDTKNNTFTGYIITEKKIGEGNGWTHIHAPSNVNKELLKTNPETQQTYLEDIRDELSEMRYEQEVLAEFGEEELGVYQKQYIQKSIDEGKRISHDYITKWDKETRKEYLRKTQGHNIRILGIDWDKYNAETNMVCMEYDRYHQNADGEMDPCFKVLFRVAIARSEFTYTNAMNKVIELNNEYKFDWIAVDRGYGETQLELFHKYGIMHPESGLADKVVGYQFAEKIEVTDPYSRKKDMKHMKPFMVNNSVNLFEKEKVIVNPNDKYMITQLEEYRVQSISATGLPTYSSENEHALDAMNLALLIFAQKYDSLLRRVYSSKIAFVNSPLDKRSLDVENREIKSDKDKREEEQLIVPIKVIRRSDGTKGMVTVSPRHHKSFYPKEFSRGLF